MEGILRGSPVPSWREGVEYAAIFGSSGQGCSYGMT